MLKLKEVSLNDLLGLVSLRLDGGRGVVFLTCGAALLVHGLVQLGVGLWVQPWHSSRSNVLLSLSRLLGCMLSHVPLLLNDVHWS